MAARNRSNELHITRVYDAPVEQVWKAWTDPDQVAQWWGPRGCSLTTHSRDLRPGGHWAYTMHGPDGTDYPNKAHYYEVEEHSKLVYDHGANDDRPPLFRVTVLFSEANGRTTMEMTMALPTPEAAEATRRFIKDAGGDATWDRLAEYLAQETADNVCFVINRSFDVSREVMFEMWTNPAHLSRWLPPLGFTMHIIKGEIKPKENTFFVMTGQDGTRMYGRAEYLDVTKPNRVVYIQRFCDEKERVVRPPFAPVWPEAMLVTVHLAAEGPERTRVVVRSEPYGPATGNEVEAFADARPSMTQGWSRSFDELEQAVGSI